jgi:hypothetical protein
MNRVLFLLLAASSLLSRPLSAQDSSQDAPVANPGRPTVSTPATLTPVGYLQFETGFLGAIDSPGVDQQYSSNEVIKLAIDSRIQLLASWEPMAHSIDQGLPSNDPGGLSLGAQVALLKGEGARPTFAISYFRSVYAGDAPDLDVGSASNSFLGLASADVHGFHYDANVFLNEVTNNPVRRGQVGQSLSISHNLPCGFNLSGEIWHFTQPFLRGNAVGSLWAISYSPRPTLVFDAGFNRGLTSTSSQWEFFTGFTYLLPHRLWR